MEHGDQKCPDGWRGENHWQWWLPDKNNNLCNLLEMKKCVLIFLPLLSWCLARRESSLFFPCGDHAEINCQTSLTPPCHLIIACNTRECWQCWAIDSWHSLKHLIIFSHKPLSDLSTPFVLFMREKKLHIKISGRRTWSQSCTHVQRAFEGTFL